MDEHRIIDALRLGPVDEPVYRARGATLFGDPRVSPARAVLLSPVRTRPSRVAWRGLWTAVAGALIVVLTAVVFRPAQTPPVASSPTPGPSRTVSASPSPIARAPDALARVVTSGLIRVLMASPSPAIPPARLAYQEAVVREVARRLGVGVAITSVPADEMLTEDGLTTWDLEALQLIVNPPVGHPAGGDLSRSTQAYLYLQHHVVARADSGFASLAGPAGRRICTVDPKNGSAWIDGSLRIGPPSTIQDPPAGATGILEASDAACQALVRSGGAEALLTNGLTPRQLRVATTKASGMVAIGGAVYVEPVSLVMRSTGRNDFRSLLRAIDEHVAAMRADGTLRALSITNFGGDDLSVAPS